MDVLRKVPAVPAKNQTARRLSRKGLASVLYVEPRFEVGEEVHGRRSLDTLVDELGAEGAVLEKELRDVRALSASGIFVPEKGAGRDYVVLFRPAEVGETG